MVRAPSGRDLTQLVFAEQVAIVYGLTPFTLAMTIVGANLVLFVMWSLTPHVILVTWYGVIHLVTLGRYLLILGYRRRVPAPEEARPWAARFVLGTLAAGCAWGVPSACCCFRRRGIRRRSSWACSWWASPRAACSRWRSTFRPTHR